MLSGALEISVVLQAIKLKSTNTQCCLSQIVGAYVNHAILSHKGTGTLVNPRTPLDPLLVMIGRILLHPGCVT